MTAHEMLRSLGYVVSSEEIRRFQRDHNKLARGAARVLVSGELDEPTLEALTLAHSARLMFMIVREGPTP